MFPLEDMGVHLSRRKPLKSTANLGECSLLVSANIFTRLLWIKTGEMPIKIYVYRWQYYFNTPLLHFIHKYSFYKTKGEFSQGNSLPLAHAANVLGYFSQILALCRWGPTRAGFGRVVTEGIPLLINLKEYRGLLWGWKAMCKWNILLLLLQGQANAFGGI